ncbi:MAG: hypothetical protein NXI00_20045 [Cytophagales bacterium]|nr:hypothetical protein [Cytophagales bacterium]
MADIVFTKDFATKKKGDEWLGIDGMLAKTLINHDQVAVYKSDFLKEKKEQKPKK